VVFLLLSMRVLPANVVLSGSALVASIKTALPAQFSVQDFGPLNGRIGPWWLWWLHQEMTLSEANSFNEKHDSILGTQVDAKAYSRVEKRIQLHVYVIPV